MVYDGRTRQGANVTFWQVFFILMIFVPLTMLWVFTLIDLFRRSDLSGIATALWAIAIVLLPLIGMVVYFILRDAQPSVPAPGPAPVQAQPPSASGPTPEIPIVATPGAADMADQLERLAELRDKTILSADEFQREKDKLLGYESA
jgi:hypothetical protein